MTAGALERLLRRAARPRGASPADGVCELCGAAVPEAHGHVVDERRGEPLCACRACALLFERAGAAQGRYRTIPRRRRRVTDVDPADLGVPVGLAFFVRRTGGAVDAGYPSPLGLTRLRIDEPTWRAATARCPPLRSMRPDVEALLINTARGADERWLVPVDDCFRLVALVRREWRGLSGGRRVWDEIERFFRALAAHGEGGGSDGTDQNRYARRGH